MRSNREPSATKGGKAKPDQTVLSSSPEQDALLNNADLPEDLRQMLLQEVERFNYERKIMFDTSMEKLVDKIKRGFIPSLNELRRPLHWVDPDSQEGTKAIADIRKLLKRKGPQGEMRANQLEYTVKADSLNSMILFMESNIKRGFINNECTPERMVELKNERSQCLKWLAEINEQDTSHGETISMYKPESFLVRIIRGVFGEIWSLIAP